MSDNPALVDEVEAVNSIYDDEIVTVTATVAVARSGDDGDDNYDNDDASATTTTTTTTTKSTTTVILKLPDLPFSFIVSFPRAYPDAPPRIVGTESTGPGTKKGEGEAALNVLRDVLDDVYTPGQVCLFDLIEEVTPLLRDGRLQQQHEQHGPPSSTTGSVGPVFEHDSRQESNQISDHDGSVATIAATATATGTNTPTLTDLSNLHIKDLNNPDIGATTTTTTKTVSNFLPSPHWTLSQPLVVNKSSFVAHAAAVHTLTATTDAITQLLDTNKKLASATHNITAWRLQSPSSSSISSTSPAKPEMVIIQDSDDDGETAAGGRLLHLMQLMDVWNVVVVVTRWYGGVKLGGDRFRCINAVARDALVRGGFAKEASGGSAGAGVGKDKAKKGGKKK